MNTPKKEEGSPWLLWIFLGFMLVGSILSFIYVWQVQKEGSDKLVRAAGGVSLEVSPKLGLYQQNEVFTASILVASPEQPINAASGTIVFSNDVLEVVHISLDDTLLSLWLQEPVFSNELGTINFEGFVFNPGFQGVVGELFSISFRAISSGDAVVEFSSGNVLAHDGFGTSILNNLGNAEYSIAKDVLPPLVEVKEPLPPPILEPIESAVILEEPEIVPEEPEIVPPEAEAAIPPEVEPDIPEGCFVESEFTAFMNVGSTGLQVRALQELLRCLNYFPAEVSSTGYYGPVTVGAVTAFQSAKGIDPVGYVGPLTRTALNNYVGGFVEPELVPEPEPEPEPAPEPEQIVTEPSLCSIGELFTRYLVLDAVGEQVRQLQGLLYCLGYLPGMYFTGYYGFVTVDAVTAFQQANGIDPLGVVGPRTRAKLNEFVN